MRRIIAVASLTLVLAASASAQFGGLDKLKGKVNDARSKAAPYTDRAKQWADVNKQWTPDQEEQIGEESAAKLINAFGLYENPDMQNYVGLVGSTVAAQGARQDITYHFAILDTDSMNAMALPGGFVFVTRGALANMKNEAELAGVLAHEVAHVDGRHLENELKDKGNLGLVLQEAQKQGSQRLSQDQITQTLVRETAKKAATFVATQPFSAGDESAADRKGTEFASKAGYDCGGLRDFLKTLSAASDDPDNARFLSAWGQTHPPYNVRVDNLTKLVAAFPASGQTLEDRFKKNINEQAFK